MTIRGIDCASYQGQPDFQKVAAAGYQFVLLKATEGQATADGPGYVNPYFAANRLHARSAGLVVGHYHFARPDQGAALDDAAHFLDVVGELEAGDVLALDVEVGSGNLAQWCLTWLQTVETATGVKPLLYSGGWFMGNHGLLDQRLSGYGLWYAAYQATQPAAPSPWGFLAVWQNSETGQVPGVAGNCDTDVFNGTRAQLLQYGYQQQPTPSPSPDPCAAVTADRDAQLAKLAQIRVLAT